MSRVVPVFVAITALLEDLHAVAVEGQATNLSSDETLALIALLRDGAAQLMGAVVAARKVEGR